MMCEYLGVSQKCRSVFKMVTKLLIILASTKVLNFNIVATGAIS